MISPNARRSSPDAQRSARRSDPAPPSVTTFCTRAICSTIQRKFGSAATVGNVTHGRRSRDLDHHPRRCQGRDRIVLEQVGQRQHCARVTAPFPLRLRFDETNLVGGRRHAFPGQWVERRQSGRQPLRGEPEPPLIFAAMTSGAGGVFRQQAKGFHEGRRIRPAHWFFGASARSQPVSPRCPHGVRPSSSGRQSFPHWARALERIARVPLLRVRRQLRTDLRE